MLDYVNVLGLPFLACLAMVAILGYLGIHVLQREIVFIDIALAQIVAVGMVATHLVVGHHEHDGFCIAPYVWALGLCCLAAVFYAFARRQSLRIPLEAVIGVSYAVAAAGALFLAGIAPHHVHVGDMLGGSILWVSWNKLIVSASAFLGAGVCFYLLRASFERISADYDAAVREGMNVAGWDILFYALIGVVITFAAPIGGVVVVFALLIIPATIGVMCSRQTSARVVIAWGTGALGALLGLAFAKRLDFSVGPAVALFLGIELTLVALSRKCHPILTGAAATVVLAGYVALFVFGPHAAQSRMHVDVRSLSPAEDEHPHHGERSEPEAAPQASLSERLERANTPQEFVALYKETDEIDEQYEIVSRAIDVDLKSGVFLALRFLKNDPPVFFRQQVIDKLAEVTGKELRFDAEQPFSAPTNQQAAEELATALQLEGL